MDKINTEAALQDEILLLETKKAEQAKLLKEEFQVTKEKFKPANMVSNILRQTAASPTLRKSIMNKTADVALVLITNLILRRKSAGILKRTISTAFVFGVKNVVLRNPEVIKKAGIGILRMLLNIANKRNKNKKYAGSSSM